MNRTLIEIFKRQAERSFAFLYSNYGFAAPQLDLDEQIACATVTIKGKNLAIQLILNERDQDIDCKIARVTEGEVTKDYARDKDGTLVRDSLFMILRRKGVRGTLFTKVPGLSLEERIPITLDDFERMLREHGKDILADSPSVFI